ncbi:HAD-superfamily subfamily IIA hydrolase [Colletotrichum zoysiae]|uniref:HAD-superfamily subfamily IIA hydrolase n=1 Tax=Colletotrichum zoysiae TaxID=1216348 RepID=A0AAD9M2B8_9PEZI|nr:HAD-superfamily subfamily IIA hydrolase [Colletotrichum zoysiae]
MRQAGRRATGLGRLSRPFTTSSTTTHATSRLAAAGGAGLRGGRSAAPSKANAPGRAWLGSAGTAGPQRRFSTKKRVFEAGETPSFAFAFDIDGVLLHVAKPIPGAAEALRYLSDNGIPFILLTNGGGRPEAARVRDLGEKLGVELSVDNFVQSHTPFQELVHGPEGLGDKTVFVTGADAQRCREIARGYGFKSVVTPADIIHAQPDVFPFELLMKAVYAGTHEPLPKPIYTGKAGGGGAATEAEALKIDAVFVFNDPRDWALDIQIIVDLLLSRGGVLGTYSGRNGDASLPGGGWQQDGQPALVYSNADLFWPTTWHQPRFGQGAFQAAVAGVWGAVTGGAALRATTFGKPFATTYRYAERVLDAHRRAVLGEAAAPLKTVYMVGDNPESDIRGANDYSNEQTEWASVLVRTGVWREERGAPTHAPKMIVDDVKAAVEWALEREGRPTRI